MIIVWFHMVSFLYLISFKFYLICVTICAQIYIYLDPTATGVMNGCESPCRAYASNLDPLQDQQEFLTTELSFQPLVSCTFK